MIPPHQRFFFSSRRRHTRSKRDWSSDVCSSDLDLENRGFKISIECRAMQVERNLEAAVLKIGHAIDLLGMMQPRRHARRAEIGRASCRERVEGSEGGGSINRKKSRRRGGASSCV